MISEIQEVRPGSLSDFSSNFGVRGGRVVAWQEVMKRRIRLSLLTLLIGLVTNACATFGHEAAASASKPDGRASVISRATLWKPTNVPAMNLKDGPVVLRVPPGVLGPVDDANFRWVVDVGLTGLDKGAGGE